MSQVKLMIQPSDIIALTQFNGNIDIDNLKPMIFIAQTTHLKAFLGLALYDKIYNDFVATALAGEYLILYNDFIKDFLSYYTSGLYVDFGGYKVNENGVYRVTGENITPLDGTETDKLGMKYYQLVANVESNFKEYVTGKNIPELSTYTPTTDTTFPWR